MSENNQNQSTGHNTGQNTSQQGNSAPTTPGQAEGTENINDQSDASPSPPQTDQAEGEDSDAQQ